MTNLTQGQELIFNVYGTSIKGKFLSIDENDVIEIEVTYDSIGVTPIGDTDRIHKGFLVN